MYIFIDDKPDIIATFLPNEEGIGELVFSYAEPVLWKGDEVIF